MIGLRRLLKARLGALPPPSPAGHALALQDALAAVAGLLAENAPLTADERR